MSADATDYEFTLYVRRGTRWADRAIARARELKSSVTGGANCEVEVIDVALAILAFGGTGLPREAA